MSLWSSASVVRQRRPSANVPFYRPPPSCQIQDLAGKYERLFGRRTLGTFVEVGAYDGESYSNTCFLADIGWRGVYVEPMPDFVTQCALRHANNNVRVFPYAVGACEGKVGLHVGGTLTTTSARQVEVYEQISWARGNHHGEVISVSQLCLDTVLERADMPFDFDLLVVDVEGAEEAVFAGMGPQWRPRVMIVELEDTHPDIAPFADIRERTRALRSAICARGYSEFHRDTINTVFTSDLTYPPLSSDPLL